MIFIWICGFATSASPPRDGFALAEPWNAPHGLARLGESLTFRCIDTYNDYMDKPQRVSE